MEKMKSIWISMRKERMSILNFSPSIIMIEMIWLMIIVRWFTIRCPTSATLRKFQWTYLMIQMHRMDMTATSMKESPLRIKMASITSHRTILMMVNWIKMIKSLNIVANIPMKTTEAAKIVNKLYLKTLSINTKMTLWIKIKRRTMMTSTSQSTMVTYLLHMFLISKSHLAELHKTAMI